MTNPQDEITTVLRRCEHTLRTLATQGRLTAGALTAFVDLSRQVRRELDRRQTSDRRESRRPSADRRAAAADKPAVQTRGTRAREE